eukprot:UN07277
MHMSMMNTVVVSVVMSILLGESHGASKLETNIMANAPLYHNSSSTVRMPYYGVEVKPLFVDPASGAWGDILYGKPGESLGLHKHHGFVYGYGLKGTWGYIEHAHEWLAGPGDLIFEEPGSVHTLYIPEDSPEDAEIFFVVYGSLEYLNEYGETTGWEDWRSFAQKYYDYCKENNIEPIDLTHPRGKAPNVTFKKRSTDHDKSDL